MTIKQTLFSGCLVALLGAEAAAQAPPEDDQAAGCPDFVRGSTLSVRTVDRGVQLTLATPRADNVRLLRAMTHDAAGYIESKERGPRSSATEEEADPAVLPPLEITVADVAGGVRVSILAVDKADVGMVREEAKKLQQLWRVDVCVNGRQMRV
jgi:hypothetical protein